jgi:hypothetical protein
MPYAMMPYAIMALVAAIVAVAIALYVRHTRKTARDGVPGVSTHPLSLNTAALPPVRDPSLGDMALAGVINAIDADMRSIELGQWIMQRLDRAIEGADIDQCGDARDLALQWIADEVPGANEVTRREIVKHLRIIVNLAVVRCTADGSWARDRTTPGGRAAAKQSLRRALSAMRASAFGKDGVLLGMPGYSERSRLPLP